MFVGVIRDARSGVRAVVAHFELAAQRKAAAVEIGQ